MRTPKEIAAELFVTKNEEDRMKARRTALELEFAAAIGVSDQWEGSKTNDFDEYKVTVSRKMNDKIDAVKLRVVAALHDLESGTVALPDRIDPSAGRPCERRRISGKEEAEGRQVAQNLCARTERADAAKSFC